MLAEPGDATGFAIKTILDARFGRAPADRPRAPAI
jgi:hypothetical protein